VTAAWASRDSVVRTEPVDPRGRNGARPTHPLMDIAKTDAAKAAGQAPQ
jgi:hypothetical protein